MKMLIAYGLVVASLFTSVANADELRKPAVKAEQSYKVSPASYIVQTSIRGTLQVAQQELLLSLWESNRSLAANDIEAVGQQVEQRYRVANASGTATSQWVKGASQK